VESAELAVVGAEHYFSKTDGGGFSRVSGTDLNGDSSSACKQRLKKVAILGVDLAV